MSRVLKDDHTGRMTRLVLAAGAAEPVSDDDPNPIDLSRLDREQLPWWIDHLKQAEASTRQLRRQLESLLAGDSRLCPVCDRAVTGRQDRIYCGAACRQRARRTALAAP